MRTILISGANRGIGRSIAEKLLKDGHCISLGIRNPEELKETILDPKISGAENILLNKYDASEPLSAKNWVKETINHFGKIDSVIHSAGIFNKSQLLFSDKDQDEIENLWRINVMGPWWLTKEAWKHIEKSNKGRLIFLVSMSGKRSKGKLAGYTMSKFALMGLCQTARNEGWENGIRVTAICPGWVNTDMAAEVKSIPKEKMTQPNDIALITSNLLLLPNSCIPFEIAVNCNLEK